MITTVPMLIIGIYLILLYGRRGGGGGGEGEGECIDIADYHTQFKGNYFAPKNQLEQRKEQQRQQRLQRRQQQSRVASNGYAPNSSSEVDHQLSSRNVDHSSYGSSLHCNSNNCAATEGEVSTSRNSGNNFTNINNNGSNPSSIPINSSFGSSSNTSVQPKSQMQQQQQDYLTYGNLKALWLAINGPDSIKNTKHDDIKSLLDKNGTLVMSVFAKDDDQEYSRGYSKTILKKLWKLILLNGIYLFKPSVLQQSPLFR